MSLLRNNNPPAPGSGGASVPPPPPPPRPSSSPFGNRPGSRAEFSILPTGDRLARFDLNQIDSTQIDSALATGLSAEQIIDFLETDRNLVERLKPRLDAAWESYQLKGAILLYPWRDELRSAVNGRLSALKQPTTYLLVTDPVLVLNVLGRSRAALLLANAPLALDRVFLNRSMTSDDPRLIALAQAGGCVESPIFEPIPEPEEPEESS